MDQLILEDRAFAKFDSGRDEAAPFRLFNQRFLRQVIRVHFSKVRISLFDCPVQLLRFFVVEFFVVRNKFVQVGLGFVVCTKNLAQVVAGLAPLEFDRFPVLLTGIALIRNAPVHAIPRQLRLERFLALVPIAKRQVIHAIIELQQTEMVYLRLKFGVLFPKNVIIDSPELRPQIDADQ